MGHSSTSLSPQVEFYFGDANLTKDKFLQQQMKETEGGCTRVCTRECVPVSIGMLTSLHTDVPVKVIADFNRMKALTSDLSLILQAIKNSSLVEVLIYSRVSLLLLP